MSEIRQYELIYIVASDATEQQIADLHTQVEEIIGRYSGTLEQDGQLGTPEARLRNRSAQGRHVRARGDHGLRRAHEGDRSPPARQRPGDPPSHRPRGRGESGDRAHAHAAHGRPRSAAGWRAACRPSGSPARARSGPTRTRIGSRRRRTSRHSFEPRTLNPEPRTLNLDPEDVKVPMREGRGRGRKAAAGAATRRTTRSARCFAAGRSASSVRTRSTTSTTRT